MQELLRLQEALVAARRQEERAITELDGLERGLSSLIAWFGGDREDRIAEATQKAEAAIAHRRSIQARIKALKAGGPAVPPPSPPSQPAPGPIPTPPPGSASTAASKALAAVVAYEQALKRNDPGATRLRAPAHLAVLDLITLHPKAGLTPLPPAGAALDQVATCRQNIEVQVAMEEAVPKRVSDHPPDSRIGKALVALDQLILAIDAKRYDPPLEVIHYSSRHQSRGEIRRRMLHRQQITERKVAFITRLGQVVGILEPLAQAYPEIDLVELRQQPISGTYNAVYLVQRRNAAFRLKNKLSALPEESQ